MPRPLAGSIIGLGGTIAVKRARAHALDAPSRGSLPSEFFPEWVLVYASLALFALAAVGLRVMMREAASGAPESALRDVEDIETGRA